MSLDNKKFKNNKTGDIVKVISSFENIAVLENKQKIDVRSLMDPNQYTEEIDPMSFFQNQGAFSALAEKIRNIPTHLIKDEEGNIPVTSTNENFNPVVNESAIIISSEEDERAELARKYGMNMDNQSVERQNQAFAKILGDDELPQIPRNIEQPEDVQRVEVNRYQDEVQVPTQRVNVEDPIITMFKRTKRNVDFKINVEVSDKIPRLDFIEMMEDSYEISMIDFLADEFTNKLLQDPSAIRNTIKDKIKQLVYGGEVKINSTDEVYCPPTQKHEPLSIEKEPVLSDELPKKPTRKPRAKKETEK